MSESADPWSIRNSIKEREEEHISPCGKYKLTVRYYPQGDGTWDYTSGMVETIIDPDGPTARAFADIGVSYPPFSWTKRNYSHFPFCWAVRPEGTLLFHGEDYQGYGVLNCRTGEKAQYLPVGGMYGIAFCWAEASWDEDSPNELRVEGCVWGGDFYVVVYDITDPWKFPYRELGRWKEG